MRQTLLILCACICFICSISFSALTASAEGELPFRADLANLWKYNLGAGNVGDIAYEYNEEQDSVDLRLDGNLSGWSPIEFTVNINLDLYSILSFEISNNMIMWSVKIYNGNDRGVDFVFEKFENYEHSESGGTYTYDLKHNYAVDLAGDKNEEDAFRGMSGLQTFKLKFFVVDKQYTGGSLTLKNLQISAPGYEGEYSQGINFNPKPEFIGDSGDVNYNQTNDNFITFDPIVYPSGKGVPAGIVIVLWVVLALNIAFAVFMFLKLFYKQLHEEHIRRKEDRK